MDLKSLDSRSEDMLAELIATITAQALQVANYVYWVNHKGKRSFFSQN